MEINILTIKELIINDDQLPLVLQGIKIEECSNNNMIANKYVPMKNNEFKFNFILSTFYKPISKSFINKE